MPSIKALHELIRRQSLCSNVGKNIDIGEGHTGGLAGSAWKSKFTDNVVYGDVSSAGKSSNGDICGCVRVYGCH